MILYFDSFITDVPFNKRFVDPNKWIRGSALSYAMPSKVDIAKYTLASYALYPWSHVLIRFTLADTNRIAEFENYARELFPQAIILQPNSANQTEYRKSIALMNDWDDDWIWYAPNNDHPIMTADLSIIDTVLAKAKSFTTSHEYISVMYSHFSEFINMSRRGSPFWAQFGRDTTVVDEDADCITYVQSNGDNTGIQIVNKKLFSYWFDSTDMADATVYRSEDVRKFHTTPDQLIVVPKREIAAHFDGYSHTLKSLIEIAPDQVPPLIIPAGFFENAIKIKYGFPDYDSAYTNVNPAAPAYAFEGGTKKTDVKSTLETLPLFWHSRISEVIENPQMKKLELDRATKKHTSIVKNPYSVWNKKCNKQTLWFLLRTIKSRFKKLPLIP